MGSMGLVLIISAAAISVALSGMRQIGERFDDFLEREMVLDQAVNTMYAQGLQMGQALRNVVLDPANQAGHKNYAKAGEEFGAALDKARELSRDKAEAARILDEVGGLRKQHAAIQQQILAEAAVNQELAAARVKKDETPLWRTIREKLMGLMKSQAEQNAARKAEMIEFTRSQTLLTLLLGVASLAVGIAVTMLLTRSIIRTLTEVESVAHSLADGDLTVQINSGSRDEMGRVMAAMRNMVEKLSGIIGEVRHTADSLSNASGQVSATAQNMNQATSQQAASVEETSASIEQMSASINQNSENAKVTDSVASQASQHAGEGGAAVKSTVAAMKQIAGKIGIIDDIA